MRPKDKVVCIIISMLIIIGWFIHGYGGGLLSGAGMATLFLVLVGKKAAAKAAARIDKRVKDIIIGETQKVGTADD